MLILVVLSLILMVLDKRVSATKELRAALSIPLVPLQYAVSYPIQVFDELSHNISTRNELIKQNLDLRAQVLLLNAEMQRVIAIESENAQLKALLSSSTKVQGKVLIAQILAVDSDPFINQVTLDKGSRDGVFIGQPVLDASGVMGQIIQVGPLTSRILLISDAHSGVPVQIARNGVRTIAVGDAYSGKLRLENVQQTADIKVGDILVTSGLGEHFPEGYPVGKVISLEKTPGLEFATIKVEPDARLDRSRQVILVWPPREAFVKLTAATKNALKPSVLPTPVVAAATLKPDTTKVIPKLHETPKEPEIATTTPVIPLEPKAKVNV